VYRLTTTASYQALIGWCASPICPHYGEEEETIELFYHAADGRLSIRITESIHVTTSM